MPIKLPWRFQLSTLLLVITTSAACIALFTAYRRQHKLELENRELREETGRPVILDANRIAVGIVQLPAVDGFRFRVYRPPGRNLVVRYAFENADDSFPQDDKSIALTHFRGNELTIDLFLEYQPQDQHLGVRIGLKDGNVGGAQITTVFANEDHWSLDQNVDGDGIGGFAYEELAVTPDPRVSDTPFVLMRCTGGTSAEVKSGRARTAVLVWLEEEPKPGDGWKPSPFRLGE